MKYSFKKDENMPLTLQNLSRQSFIKKILEDVLTDITICKLEGWDWKEYPRMIKKEMERILKNEKWKRIKKLFRRM